MPLSSSPTACRSAGPVTTRSTCIVDLEAPARCSRTPSLWNRKPVPWRTGDIGLADSTLDAGRYMLHYEVRLNNANGSSTYLNQARRTRCELSTYIAITDPIQAVLQDIIDETATLADFSITAMRKWFPAMPRPTTRTRRHHRLLPRIGRGRLRFRSCEDIRVDTTPANTTATRTPVISKPSSMRPARPCTTGSTQGLDQLEFDEYKDLSPTSPIL